MNILIPKLLEALDQGRKAALATILTHDGSTPRTSGSRMLVLDDGTIQGTIGGGLVEAEVIKRALAMMPGDAHAIVPFQLSSRLKESLDMVCGGSLTVFIETLTSRSRGFYGALNREIREGRRCVKVSEVTGSDEDLTVRQSVMGPGGRIVGEDLVPESLEGGGLYAPGTGENPRMITFGDRRLIMEPMAIQKALYLFGGGHVSQAVARIGAMLDFRVVVIDDRAEFANALRFPDAHECIVVRDFPEFFHTRSIDGEGYVVILTRGHSHDQTVLAHALKTGAGYIGMIGSRTKRDNIYRNLLAQGVSQEDLDRVHSPIGLEIHAETPAEIAVSITAELIDLIRSRD
ncbi:MAG: XdhC family protein [Pseudomonadota bacterium]